MANIFKPPCDEGVIQSAPDTSPCVKKLAPWILAATIIGSSMAFIDGTVVNVALPVLQADLGATVTDLQWIVEAYALFIAALILVGGSLGDHFGRRRIFASGVVLFGKSCDYQRLVQRGTAREGDWYMVELHGYDCSTGTSVGRLVD
jgi:hypothetical protein